MNDSGSNIHARRKRRTTADTSQQRNYLCPCGKSYLSYPALYTHIKNKHQGQAPKAGQVSITRSSERVSAPYKQQPDSDHQKQLSTPDQALAATINHFRAYTQNKQLNYTLSEAFQSFPQEMKKQIESQVQTWIQGKGPMQKILDSGIKAASIDQIISKFLSLLLNKIDKNIIVEFILVLLLFRKHLNEGYIRQGGKGQYCKQGSGVKMLDTINQFLLYYFNYYLKKSGIQIVDAVFIGVPKRQFICVGKLIFLFSRWVYLQRYTNCKLKINNFG